MNSDTQLISAAMRILGRRGKGKPKRITEQEAAARRERMRRARTFRKVHTNQKDTPNV